MSTTSTMSIMINDSLLLLLREWCVVVVVIVALASSSGWMARGLWYSIQHRNKVFVDRASDYS
jgi:hypothetical protein